jgi:hypothetical protein
MNKAEQLKRAKSLANIFLRIPITTTEYSPIVIMHPFFESSFLYNGKEMFNALEDTDKYNDYLHFFSEKIIQPCESLEDLLSLIRKSYRLAYILYMERENIITKKECGNLLAEQWTLIENLSVDTNVQKRTILRWIKAADKEKIMDEEELKKYKEFPEVLTVYRGCRTAKALKGMSWTLSEEKGRWFADRFSTNRGGVTYRAKIRKEDIIAYTNSRGEQEIILDYQKIFDVEEV